MPLLSAQMLNLMAVFLFKEMNMKPTLLDWLGVIVLGIVLGCMFASSI
jgi:hypothetical protein